MRRQNSEGNEQLIGFLSAKPLRIKVIVDGQLQYEVIFGDVPNVLHLFMNDGGFTKQKVLYGTKNGRLGLVNLEERSGSVIWELASSTSSAISAIYCHSFTGNVHPDIVVGKEDGVIDIFTVDESDMASFRQSYVRLAKRISSL